MSLLLFGVLLVVSHAEDILDTDAPYPNESRQCEGDSCTRTEIIQYGGCKLDQTGVCIANDGQLDTDCTVMVNSNSGSEIILQVCADPKELYDVADPKEYLKFAAILPYPSSYCFTDKQTETNVYAGFCETMCKGKCNQDTKECDCSQSIETFSAQQMIINQNQVKKEDHLLLAFDGTGSKFQFENTKRKHKRYKSEIGLTSDKSWIWQSHVGNFWEDYEGLSYYWYGPDHDVPWIVSGAGGECEKLSKSGIDASCKFLQELYEKKRITLDDNKKNIIGDYFIDIIGYSRGGYVAMEIARSLQFDGCKLGDVKIKNIPVRWMGLYDPVRKVIDFPHDHDTHKIGPYVQNVSIAERSRKIKSRWFRGTELAFKYASRGGCENPNYSTADGKCSKYTKREFEGTSHGGMGGTPGQGDCKDDCSNTNLYDDCEGCKERGYTEKQDRESSLELDMWMRKNAVVNNVPIRTTVRQYYQSPDDGEIFAEYLIHN